MPNTYKCKDCGLTNSKLNTFCYCGQSRGFTLSRLETNAEIRLWYQYHDLWVQNIIGGDIDTMTTDERVELHSKFYKEAVTLIQDMSYEQQIAWEEELEKIVVEAKAKLQASTTKRREKEAGMSKADRDKLISRPDMTVTEGLTVPKVRKDRMSKAEKLLETYKDMVAAGLMTQADVDTMMGTIKVDDSKGQTLASATGKTADDRTYTFNGDFGKGGTEKEPAQPKSEDTQEGLLADLLEMVDMSALTVDKIEYLEKKIETATMLVTKTVSKQMPEKLINMIARLEQLKQEKKDSEPFDVSGLFK